MEVDNSNDTLSDADTDPMLDDFISDSTKPATPITSWDDECWVCKDGGELICCDGCPKVYHVCCIQRSIDLGIVCTPPDGDDPWYCQRCVYPNGQRVVSDDSNPTDSLQMNSGKRRRISNTTTVSDVIFCFCEVLSLWSRS